MTTGDDGPERSAAHRAARRDVVRRLHPDRGGDPEEFRAALQRVDEQFAAPPATRPTPAPAASAAPTGVHITAAAALGRAVHRVLRWSRPHQ
jgi:hypothetical protein